jgi:hypothetical protein
VLPKGRVPDVANQDASRRSFVHCSEPKLALWASRCCEPHAGRSGVRSGRRGWRARAAGR